MKTNRAPRGRIFSDYVRPWCERTMTYNSRLAQELGKWADTQPGGEAIHDALFRAYFVEARDISQPAVLEQLVQKVAGQQEAEG